MRAGCRLTNLLRPLPLLAESPSPPPQAQPTPTPTTTATSSVTATATQTASNTATSTISTGTSPSQTGTPTASPTASISVSVSPSPSGTASQTSTATPSATATYAIRPWALAPLAQQTFIVSRAGYPWALRPFVSVMQGTFLVGTYLEFTTVQDATCPNGARYVAQRYTNGDLCGTNPRSATVSFFCSTNGTTFLSSATEPSSCVYALNFTIDCAPLGGTLCEWGSAGRLADGRIGWALSYKWQPRDPLSVSRA